MLSSGGSAGLVPIRQAEQGQVGPRCPIAGVQGDGAFSAAAGEGRQPVVLAGGVQTAVGSMAGAAGVGLIYLARWMDARPGQTYSVYDFWHTSPNFFLIRIGLLLAILCVAYAWCRWGAATRGFSPLIQLGQTSLLVYWVHIEFVYGGRLRILPSHANSIPVATFGLLFITVAMLVLSRLRTEWKSRGGLTHPATVPSTAH